MSVWSDGMRIFAVNIRAKPDRGMQNFGNPDLLVLFTGTMSHKMLSIAMGQAKKKNIPVAHSATSSVSALKNILDIHAKGEK